jgi:hypothetical protein
VVKNSRDTVIQSLQEDLWIVTNTKECMVTRGWKQEIVEIFTLETAFDILFRYGKWLDVEIFSREQITASFSGE